VNKMPAGAGLPGCLVHQARCAPRRAQWRGAFRLCVLSMAASMQQTRALVTGNLRSSFNETYSPQGSPASVAEEFYLLERVGFQAGGIGPQPRSPHYPKAKCLTAGGPDRKGGIALGWDTCQDRQFLSKPPDQDLLKAQAFRLLSDGTIYNKKHKLCMRRMSCSEGNHLLGYIYDLGQCSVDSSTQIQVNKALANNVQHMKELGTLASAVATELCELCGPYNLKNRCMGSRECGDSYQAKPGWTKLASQYIGFDAVHGRSEYGRNAGGEDSSYDEMGIDMAGIGPTRHEDGLCGSYVTDAPAVGSYFYTLKADFS